MSERRATSGAAVSPCGPRHVRRALDLLTLLLAAGCASSSGRTVSLADPFAYCASVGTADAPDARYTGPAVPASIAAGLRRAFGAPPDAPLEVFTRGTTWRCMGGRVYACTVGANLPCQARADKSRTPSPAIAEFCRQNPAADAVPAVATGRETIYAWRCAGGLPEIARQIDTPDPRGFLSRVWHEIPPSAP